MRRQADAVIDDDGPALEQHCTNVSRGTYSQPRALQCLRVYTREDYICASAGVIRIVCLTSISVHLYNKRAPTASPHLARLLGIIRYIVLLAQNGKL